MKGRLLDLLCIHGREKKLQASTSKLQRSTKTQAPKPQTNGWLFCILEFGPSLELGMWNLELSNRSPRLVSRQRLLGFSEALIFLSYSGETKTPSTKPQAPEKLQHPNFKARARPRGNEGHGHRCFLGVWSLGFEASEGWSSRQVALLRLPVISRVLCF